MSSAKFQCGAMRLRGRWQTVLTSPRHAKSACLEDRSCATSEKASGLPPKKTMSYKYPLLAQFARGYGWRDKAAELRRESLLGERAIEEVAAHVEDAVPARAEVLLSRVGGQLDQLFFGEMLAELGVEFVADVDGRTGKHIGQTQERLLRWGELLDFAVQKRGDFVVREAVHSAAGRIDVDSKRASDARRGAQLHDGALPRRNLGFHAEQELGDRIHPEDSRHTRADFLGRQVLAKNLTDPGEHLTHQERSFVWIDTVKAGHVFLQFWCRPRPGLVVSMDLVFHPKHAQNPRVVEGPRFRRGLRYAAPYRHASMHIGGSRGPADGFCGHLHRAACARDRLTREMTA